LPPFSFQTKLFWLVFEFPHRIEVILIGKQLAHYQVTSLLGKGGMGEVYRARDAKLGREVALKVLPAGFDEDPERLARFQREARTLASLQHPNVASIYGLETAEGLTFLVMELVEGEDLSERLTRGAVPLDRALDIAAQVATGLEAAHDKGIVHRDLKPANIKLGTDGSVKILDFGLARAYGGDTETSSESSATPTLTAAMTAPGMIMGTAAYMSPEQARGKVLDRRTDIFSFGALLYEMLTGIRPFQGESVSDILASILKEQPDPDALPAQVPPAVRHLILRCLEKDSRKRLRDMGEARLIIEAVQGGDSTATTVLGHPAVSSDEQPAGRRRSGLREMAAWAVALVALIGLGWFAARDQGPPAVAVRANKFVLPLPEGVDIKTTHDSLGISPDGTRVAYVGNNRLFVRKLDAWEPTEIPQSEGAGSPFWSPDSSWLVYTVGREVWKVRPDGTQRMLVGTGGMEFSQNSGGAWLADDRIVLRGRFDLESVPANGGNFSTFVAKKDSSIVDFHEPSALPGGKELVVVVHTPEAVDTIGLVTLDGSLKTLLHIPGSNLSTPRYSNSGHILFQNNQNLWAVPYSRADQVLTGEPFPLAQNTAIPSISEDGTLVYIQNAGTILRRFVLVDREGNIVTRLGQPADIWAAFALSPDGTRAVGTLNNPQLDLMVYDDRSSVSRLTFTELEHDMVSFGYDGQTVYFATGNETDYRISSKRLDRNEPEQVIVPPGPLGSHYYAACPAVSFDGSLLFYSARNEGEKQDIAWVDLKEGGKPQLFLSGAAAEYSARPSPSDHHFVAYVSDESGADQVYLTTWPDADQKLPVSIDGGYWPRWKGDGTELFFARDNEIYAVDVQYQPLRLGQPRQLFSRPEHDDRQPFGWPALFDVTFDGQLFLVTELVVEKNIQPTIAVIQNWSASLQ
jgi:Tol biopolymer transport system component/predicted Ser/Thr protein kinase